MNADFGKWQTVRSLSTQAAQGTSAPSAGAFVSIALAPTPRVEIRVRGASLVGSPGSVTLGIWRLSDGSVDKLGTMTIAAGDIATPIPSIFECYDPAVYVTVESFSGGTVPTMSGTIEARAVSGG